MHLWQANLGRGVSTDEFSRNLRAILSAGGPRAVYAFQEIDEADQPEEMDILWDLTVRTHVIVGDHTAVPILVPNHFDIEGELQTVACKGLAKFTPHRPINEVQIRIGKNLAPVFLDGHMPIDREETQELRAEFREALRDRVRANRESGGAWLLDTNTRKGWPRITKGEKTVINAGIDKSKAWAPKGWRVTVSDRRTVALSIDGHDAHGARIRWERSA